MTNKPLEGIRVADFSWWLAGPYCSMLLAMAGADVVRIESSRRLEPGRANPGFNNVNLNKRAIRLNLTCPEGLAIARSLVQVSDVVVENFSPGTMERFGLGYKELSRLKPDLVMVSISAMGQEGPEGNYTGFGGNFSALSGIGYLTSYIDGIPTEVRMPMDTATGTSACLAVLAALQHRATTGEGQYIDLSAQEAVISVIGDIFLDYPLNQREPTPMGNGHPTMSPHGVYPCREEDSWITIAVGEEAEWQNLCRSMNRPDLLDDVRFKDAVSRWQHREELDALLAGWTPSFTDIELMALLQEAGVAAMPSFNNKELYEDRHLKERRLYQEVRPPELDRPFTVLGPPFMLTGTPLEVCSAAPSLGQHNEEVFCDLLGLAPEEMERLVKEQVVF